LRNTTLGILAAGLVLAAVAYLQGGGASVVEGGLISWHTLLEAAPLIVAAFLLSGLMQVLISRDMINRWLGGSSGWRGLFLGAAAGAVIPGGPYGYYPIIATLIKAGAEVGPLIAFIGGKGAWSLSRLPMELAFLGPQLTLIRFVLMLPVPILMAVIARLLFPNISSELRQWQLEATGEGTSDSQEGTVDTP
jgi:uncharacterized membrane protein YraQ (UPF0718 family)